MMSDEECGSCRVAVLQLHRARQVIDDERERTTEILRKVEGNPKIFGDVNGLEAARLRGELWGLMKARATVSTSEERALSHDMRREMFG